MTAADTQASLLYSRSIKPSGLLQRVTKLELAATQPHNAIMAAAG
jgi:hypothetical protein